MLQHATISHKLFIYILPLLKKELHACLYVGVIFCKTNSSTYHQQERRGKLYLHWNPSKDKNDKVFLGNDVCIPLQPWAPLACPLSKISSNASPHDGWNCGFPNFLQFHLKVNGIQSLWKLFPWGEILFSFCLFVCFQKWPEKVNPISVPRGWLRGEDCSLVTWHLRRHQGKRFILFLSIYLSVIAIHLPTLSRFTCYLSLSLSEATTQLFQHWDGRQCRHRDKRKRKFHCPGLRWKEWVLIAKSGGDSEPEWSLILSLSPYEAITELLTPLSLPASTVADYLFLSDTHTHAHAYTHALFSSHALLLYLFCTLPYLCVFPAGRRIPSISKRKKETRHKKKDKKKIKSRAVGLPSSRKLVLLWWRLIQGVGAADAASVSTATPPLVRDNSLGLKKRCALCLYVWAL